MINKKLGVLCLALASVGLMGCGGNQTESQKSWTNEPINLQMTGSISTARNGFTANWNPGADSTFHFDEGEANGYRVLTLKGVVLAAGDAFKFTFDDKWSNDFGYDGIDPSSAVYANFENDGGNAKVVTAGTYDFVYHPFAVIEGLKGKIVVTAAA